MRSGDSRRRLTWLLVLVVAASSGFCHWQRQQERRAWLRDRAMHDKEVVRFQEPEGEPTRGGQSHAGHVVVPVSTSRTASLSDVVVPVSTLRTASVSASSPVPVAF